MEQPDFAALNEPVPTVKSADIRRLWSFLSSEKISDPLAEVGTAFSYSVVAQQCNVNSNVVAVFLRAALVHGLVQQGLLESWREGDELHDRVFDIAAAFPLSLGLADVDSQSFITALE
jgi:hypothetical protein